MLRDALRQVRNGRFGDASASNHFAPDVHQAVEKRARGDDNGLGPQLDAPDSAHADGLSVLYQQLIGLILPDVQTVGFIDMAPPFPDEFPAVALRPRAPDGRSFAQVQHAELDGCGVCDERHLPSERVNLADNLSFGNASDGRIARHLRYFVHVHRHQTGPCTHVSTGAGRLAACVSTPDDQHIVFQYHDSSLLLRLQNYKKILEISCYIKMFCYICKQKQGNSTNV